MLECSVVPSQNQCSVKMSEELLVVLNRSENAGFGFSLLGKPGLPPIIYNILDDSPAAESGEVSVAVAVGGSPSTPHRPVEGRGRLRPPPTVAALVFRKKAERNAVMAFFERSTFVARHTAMHREILRAGIDVVTSRIVKFPRMDQMVRRGHVAAAEDST